jgi:hypothetical protein
MAAMRAPKQWSLTKQETITSFEVQRLFNNGGYNNNNQGQRPCGNTILA